MGMLIPQIVPISLPFLSLSCFCFFFLLLLHLLLRRPWRCNWSSGHGPPTYPLLGCLIAFYKNRFRILDWYTEMLAQSPTQTIVVQRLGARRTIITASPDNVEYILKTKFDNFPKGKAFTEILGDLLGRGIFNVDGELWHTQRKLASHEFTTKSLRELVISTLESEVNERLVPILEAAAAAGGAVLDLQDLLRRFAFDTICKVSLGTDPGCLDPSLPVSELARSFDIASAISARRAMSPVFAVWKVKRALGIGSERRLKEAIGLVHEKVTELIRCKKEEKKRLEEEEDNSSSTVSANANGRDLLSRLISGGLDEEVIRDMVISFIMAGRDTTSAALTWLFWLLGHHPEIEKQVMEEASAAERLDYERLKEMKVLKACLSECMRLYPPVAWDSKHAREHDTLPDGTRVCKGDRVTYFPYGMGRMETVWGKDQLEFNPGRWLQLGSSSAVQISPYKFPVFQGGPRICLGKEMAFTQMEYVVAAVVKRFEFRPVRQEPAPVYVPLLTAHMDGGLKVVVREREMNRDI